MSEGMARRRVKLYALNAERQWDDRGTGHVTSAYVERLKGMSLLVRAESDGSLLLESKIMSDTAYQKQQGTLVVWSEGENFDLALSFQEKVGCDEIWEKICQVQGKDPSVEITQEIAEESEDERYDDVSESNPWVELPICDIAALESINEAISNCLHSPVRREKLAIALENEGYIKKLLSVFHICEDLENTEGLHLLYEIFKNIFLLNKNALFEIMFADDMIFDVVGAFEYDPSSPYPKRHRLFLKSIVKFKEVIPIENTELLSKIHQTYRVQYIQEVVFPTPAVFEENMLSTLSSFIFFNKVEIVSLIQEDERFLHELFHQLGSSEEEVDVSKKRDLTLFLKEFCTFSQTLQPVNRESFFKTLSNMGALSALECALTIEDPQLKATSTEILSYIVEFSPSMVREYMLLQQHKVEEEQNLINIIIEQMVLDSDREMGSANQLMGILRILIDPENMMSTVSKSERADFLSFFYKHSMHSLVAPLLSNTVGDKVAREDASTTQLLSLILELLSFCVEHHTYHVKNYIVSKDLLNRILVLMKSKHTFLVLSALRFLRKVIGLKDDFYNRHIVNTNLFGPVIEVFMKNNGRYNLLDSAILELFEFIKLEDIKALYFNIVEKHGATLAKVDYVQTFQSLRIRYEQHIDSRSSTNKENTNISSSLDSLTGVSPRGAILGAGSPGGGRFRRDVREMDVEQEMWFNSDEEEMEENQIQQPPVRSSTPPPPLPVVSEKQDLPVSPTLPLSPKETILNNNDASADSPKSPLMTCKKVSLVDYDENSDEEDEPDTDTDKSHCQSAKRPRLSND